MFEYGCIILYLGIVAQFRINDCATIIGSGDFIIPDVSYNLTCHYTQLTGMNTVAFYPVHQRSFVVQYLDPTGPCIYNSAKPCEEFRNCSCDRNVIYLCYKLSGLEKGVFAISCIANTNDKSEVLTVKVAEQPLFSPTIIKTPEGDILEGSTNNISLLCNVSGGIPEPTFTWSCEKPIEVIENKNITLSELTSSITVAVNRTYNNKTCTCTANHLMWLKPKTSVYTFVIFYGPNRVELSPSQLSYTVNETTDNVGPIYCTADCKPDCTLKWIGPNLSVDTSVLNLTNIRRNQTGDYFCTASNFVSSRQSIKVSIIVQYGPSLVVLSPATSSYTVNETESLGPIYCTVDCKPKCVVKWTGPNLSVDSSSLNISTINRNQTGDYRCTTSNVVSSMQSINVSVIVQYGPSKVELSPSTPSYTVNETTGSLGPINCIADCKPICTMQWTGPNLPANITSALYLNHINRSQAGDYQCTASNVINSMLTNLHVIVQYGPIKLDLRPPEAFYIVNETKDSIGPIYCTADCRPNCTIKWTGPNIPADTTSELNLPTINRTQTGDYECTARNVIGSYRSIVRVVVQYGPSQVRLLPPMPTYMVNETIDNVGPIYCTAECKPNCTIKWYGPDLSADTTSILNLTSVKRNQTGNYRCNASNVVSIMQSIEVTVIVQYKPQIIGLSSNSTVKENDTVIMECNVDSLPKSEIGWIFNNISLNESGNFDVEKSVKEKNIHTNKLIIHYSECLDMGNYSCQAFNIIGSDSNTTELIVNCSPRLNSIEFINPTIFTIKDKEPINVSIPIIAYPSSHIRWTFKPNNGSSVNVTSNITNSARINRQVSNLFIDNPGEDNFGNYTIEAYNQIGEVRFIHSIEVKPERKPDSPQNVTCKGRLNSVYVNWKSGYNGGTEQHFIVFYSEYFNGREPRFSPYSEMVKDSGKDLYQYATVQPLYSGRTYVFKVHAINRNNYTESDNYAFCNTSIETEEIDNRAGVGAAVGGSAAGLVIITAGILIFLLKRKKQTKDTDKELINRKNLTTIKTDVEDEDGLHDNILYQSASSFIAKDDSDEQETVLYAETRKPPKGKRKDEVHVNALSETKKVNKMEYKLNQDVYENMDTVDNISKGNLSKNQRNKDGLQYAELVFSPLTNGSKFVIHGLEDKTVYAQVDTSQKIDPLPDSDDEDQYSNSKSR